jgi:hypothetical protein
MVFGVLFALALAIAPRMAAATAMANGLSFSLGSGKDIRLNVTVERGEALVAYLVPHANSDGSTRLEAFLGNDRIGRASGSRGEVLRWTLPMGVATARLPLQLRFTCRSRTCRGTAQYVVSTSDHSPAPPVSVFVNQRAFRDTSGFCRGDSNATTYDGACMCSDSAAAMSLTMAGGVEIADTRQIATDIWDETLTARKPYGGAQISSAFIDAIEQLHSYSCTETAIASTTFEQRLKIGVRLGDPVLFRSRGFSGAGHYVAVLGFEARGNDLDLIVNDPMGRWRELNRWSLNGESASSNVGQGVRYALSRLRSGASVIICSP